MESSKPSIVNQVDAEEERAQLQIWEYVFGFTPMAVVKCAIQLQIPDVLETHGGAMTHSDLSTVLGCSPAILHRIMRYLIHRGIFKLQSNQDSSSTCYVQTPLSKLLMKRAENNFVSFILLQTSPCMISSWHSLSQQALASHEGSSFKATHGDDIWVYAAANPSFAKFFNDAMASHTRVVMPALIDHHPTVFKGIESVVDVGGADGTSLRTLVKAFPWIHGINFDLPHVVSMVPQCAGIEHVAGNMFEMVPKADAVLLKWVLHDWSDEDCIQILTKCREAVPESTGKVVILEAVIGGVVIMICTEKGKERTVKEWEHVINAAGFRKFSVSDIKSVVSVIEAYP